MVKRQQNYWNWSATCYVYTPGFREYLTAYDTEQYWDGTRQGHYRLMTALIEKLEGERDRLGLAFRLYQPTAIRGKAWAEGMPEVTEID